MMNTTNYVRLTGNLGQDVQIFNFESGTKKAVFTLATTENFKNQKGEWVKNTTWHNVIAWGKNADLMATTLSKGVKVMISGSLRNNTYEDKSGVKKYTTEVVVHEFIKLSSTPSLMLAESCHDDAAIDAELTM
ncbi:MAG: single-stranded DNA-binding protein [Bacteroidota bacterium]